MKTTDEETILEQQNLNGEETKNESDAPQAQPQEKKKSQYGRMWADMGIGATAGVSAGIIGTLFTSGTIPTKEDIDVPAPGPNNGNDIIDDGLTTPVVTDGHLPIAHGVNDSMSFSEAFRTAHDEVGPGGVFEWHGQLYGTYTAAEWRALSSEERLEYNNHLRVVGKPDYASNVSHHDTESHDVAQTTGGEFYEGPDGNAAATAATHQEESDEGEIAQVVATNDAVDDDVVEVLGVGYTQIEGHDVAVGGMTVNGQNVYVLDADTDGVGDILVTDVNGDGLFDENEIIDISDQHVNMSDFQTTNPDDISSIGGDDPDIMNM